MLNKKKFSNIEARIVIIQNAYDRIKSLPTAKIPVTEGLVFSFDQAGNEPRAISCLKESIFESKDLLDLLLVKLNKADSRVPKKYDKFIIGLAKGDFDQYKKIKKEINFLKQSIRFIHSLREIRNRLKLNYHNIQIFLINQKYFAKMDLKLSPTCLKIIDYQKIMQIKNYDEALENGKYYVQIDIEKEIEEELQFWEFLIDNSSILSL